jgi:hypothetical protein
MPGLARLRGPVEEAVAADAPEVHARNRLVTRAEDAVEDVEAHERRRADLATAEEEGASVVDRVDAEHLVEESLVP